MTVFKTILKIIASYKGIIIMYSIILLFFGIFNMKTNESSLSFEKEKPDIVIVNEDEEVGITKHLVEYLEESCNHKEIDSSSLADALFYRDINAIIYIPEGYRSDTLNGKQVDIKIETTGDYMSSLAMMMLEKYTKLVNTYQHVSVPETQMISLLDDTLESTGTVDITSKVDTSNLTRTSYYYSFANYSLLAGCVYVVCLVLASFKKTEIHKRTVISSTNYRKYNWILLIANSLFSIFLWALYVILSFILIGDMMFSSYGLLYILSSFVFMLSCLTMAFVIGNLITDKNAISGIVNVVALGSSFLCGAFVPAQFLPSSVLAFAHILPSYWYIDTNTKIEALEVINFETLRPIFMNLLVLGGFIIGFILLANMISRKKRVIN